MLTLHDADLVEAARSGDRAAFADLYARYGSVVHGVLLARVPPRDAEDLVQDVFLIALRRLSTLRESGAFGGWLLTIARNRAVDYHRRAREVAVEVPEAAAEDEPQRRAREILEQIQGLPEAYRETLV